MTDAGPDVTADVLIVGGGIAGLACALHVRTLDQACRITIIEADSHLGGKVAGEVVYGCVVDGAADVCIGAKLRATRMFCAASLADLVIEVNPGRLPTYESRDGRLYRSPVTFNDELLTFRSGMRELVDVAISTLNNVTVMTETAATSIQRTGDGHWLTTSTDGRLFASNVVTVAIPAKPAASLLAAVAPQESTALGATHYPPTTTVTMAWRSEQVPRVLDGTGYLIVKPQSPVTACTWTSSKNPTHAPSGIALVRGYARCTARDAVSLVRSEIQSTLGVSADPLFTRVYEWPDGIAAYSADHQSLVRELERALEPASGLFVAGSAFHGVGIPDCILSGERAAESAVSYLAASQPREAA